VEVKGSRGSAIVTGCDTSKMSHLVVSAGYCYPRLDPGGDVGERLESWKEIAAYLDREVRTVQRWARARGLPVHRLPGGGEKPRVFSLKSEIDAWLRLGADRPREQPGLSVAVLPFLNLGGSAEDQYFGDGLADDIIDALVRMPGLRVTARTSSFAFSGRGHDVREIGERLHAAWLIEGSVRRDGERVRVSAQLVNTHDGYHAWSDRFDAALTDIFAIQDEIAASIARALRVTLAVPPRSGRPTKDTAAYGLWVKGRSISQRWTRETLEQARVCYEAAIARDPGFARPYFGLAELFFYAVQFGLTTSADPVPRLRETIATSLELDDRFGETHALHGVMCGLLDYDWPGADAAFRRALELSPGSANVLIQHAWYYLVPTMQIARALDQAQQAITLDPISPLVQGLLGLVYVAARQYPRAVEACAASVQLAPSLWWLHWFYGTALLLNGEVAGALQQFHVAYTEIHQPLVVGGMCLVYGLGGRRKEAEQFLAELERAARTGYVPPAAFAFAYIGLGDDRAFEWLDKAIDARDPVATHLPSMPLYDGIRHDPRFSALLRKMHLGQGEKEPGGRRPLMAD
jgi:TolB-like protein